VSANVKVASAPRATSVLRAYDVCVVGSRLGGVAAGALLARRGFRVLHVDTTGTGTGYDEAGWRLPWGPSLLPALRGMPSADAVLAELGLGTDASRILESSRPALQVLLPRHRVDLPVSPTERVHELTREWPGEAARLESALVEARALLERDQAFLAALPPLPPRGLRARWRLHRAGRLVPGGAGAGPAPLASLGDHPLAVALRAAWPFLGSLDGAPTPFGLARTLGAALQGTLRVPGGEGALAALARRRIAETRGELLGGDGDAVPALGLELSGGKVAALRVKGPDVRHTARAFVFAGDPATLPELLGKSALPAEALAPALPSRRLFAMSWVLRADALPAPLGDTVVAHGHGGAPLLLQSFPGQRPANVHGDPVGWARVLTAATPAPLDGDVEALAADLRRSVAEFLPFLDRATLHESIPSTRPGGATFHPLLPERPDRVLGVGGVPTTCAISNLFFAGPEVLPGLGIEGQFHAARQAADAVEMHLGAKARPK
jgi:phytoene dehydrogenase-like protein